MKQNLLKCCEWTQQTHNTSRVNTVVSRNLLEANSRHDKYMN